MITATGSLAAGGGGWDDERIARQLDITATTVAVHRKHIRQKLELHNDRELVAYARVWGLDKTIEVNPDPDVS